MLSQFSFIAGLIFVQANGLQKTFSILTTVLIIILPLMLLGFLTIFGDYAQMEYYGRAYDGSGFYIEFIMVLILPMFWLSLTKREHSKFKNKCIIVLGYLLCLIFSYISATKSTFLGLVVSSGLVCFFEYNRKVAIGLPLLILSSILVFINWDSLISSLGFLGHRLQTFDYNTEGRWVELQDMTQQVGEYLIIGAGNGIGVYSSISAKIGTFYTNDLHVGLANFLLKGGVIGLFAILIPGIAGIIKIIANKPNPLIQGSFTSLIAWYAMAATTSGYNSISLFMLGIITQVLFSQKTSSKQ